MSRDVSELMGTALGRAAREAIHNVSESMDQRSRGPLSGTRGLLAGAGLVVIAPLARKGAGKLFEELDLSDGGRPLRQTAGAGARSVKKAGGRLSEVSRVVPDQLKPHHDAKGAPVPGVGKGRRIPVQVDVDIGAPVRTVYNQWTQFEEWPRFMHRLQDAVQIDDTHVRFKSSIWGISKEFTAEIVEQRPDERIQWRVTDGVTHTGVVTFHELAPRLTRVEVNLDIEPGSLIEKAGRGMRHVSRAVRADVGRFKAYVLMRDSESGEWRGEIHDARVRSARRAASSSSGGKTRRSRAPAGTATRRKTSSGDGDSSKSARSSSRTKSERTSRGGSAKSAGRSPSRSGGSSSRQRATAGSRRSKS